jgi:putative transposase
VSDDHAGLRQAIREILPEAAWQRCYVHFLRNALDYVPRKVDDDCLRELRWLYDRRDLAEARRDLAAWLAKWQATCPKLCRCIEEHIERRRLPLSDDHQGRRWEPGKPSTGCPASITNISSRPTSLSV